MPAKIENRLNNIINEIKEIKKQIILEKIGKIKGTQAKINKWKTLGSAISSMWNDISAVEEISLQREKT
ncbi:MAG: hypothetical protein ACP5Q3_16315 [bacterium]